VEGREHCRFFTNNFDSFFIGDYSFRSRKAVQLVTTGLLEVFAITVEGGPRK
jgi:hypothetical protein